MTSLGLPTVRPATAAAPTDGPLVDSFGRVATEEFEQEEYEEDDPAECRDHLPQSA